MNWGKLRRDLAAASDRDLNQYHREAEDSYASDNFPKQGWSKTNLTIAEAEVEKRKSQKG